MILTERLTTNCSKKLGSQSTICSIISFFSRVLYSLKVDSIFFSGRESASEKLLIIITNVVLYNDLVMTLNGRLGE